MPETESKPITSETKPVTPIEEADAAAEKNANAILAKEVARREKTEARLRMVGNFFRTLRNLYPPKENPKS